MFLQKLLTSSTQEPDGNYTQTNFRCTVKSQKNTREEHKEMYNVSSQTCFDLFCSNFVQPQTADYYLTNMTQHLCNVLIINNYQVVTNRQHVLYYVMLSNLSTDKSWDNYCAICMEC